MKIKEVCTRTGLSERAVRFYCEQQLLAPEKTELRGRVYLEFDEEDVAVLMQIARLRASGFSLDEIRTAQNEPHMIGTLIEALRARLRQEQGEQSRVLEQLDAIPADRLPRSAEELAAQLDPQQAVKPYVNGAVRREGEISFREFCAQGGSPDENGYYTIDANVDRGRIVFIGYSIWYWLGYAVGLLGILIAATANGGGFFFAFLIETLIYGLLYFFFCRGALWARILHILRAAVAAVIELSLIPGAVPRLVNTVYHSIDEMGNKTTQTVAEMSGSWWLVAFSVAVVILHVTAAVLLAANPWIKDYLYDRSTRI